MSFGGDVEAWRAALLETLRQDAGSRPAAVRGTFVPAARFDVLAFQLRSETFGVSIDEVREILLPKALTPLPRAPGFVKGVLSLRGTVLPVVDLAARLGLPPAPPTRSCRILVLRDGEEHMGFWVDRVTGVVRFSKGDVGTTEFASAVDPRFLGGIGYDRRGTLVAVLRADTLCEFNGEAP